MVKFAASRVASCVAAIGVLVACDASRSDWETARATNTRESYERFLERHPTGDLADRARAAMLSISAAEEARRRQLAEAEARKARAAAALKTAARQGTIPAFGRIESEFAGTPEAAEAQRALGELRAARRAEVREVQRVAIIVDAPPLLADVPIASAAQEILALAGVGSAPSAQEADATLRISLRESSQTAEYRGSDGSAEKVARLATGAAVTGELRFEVRGGAKVSRPFNGRVPTAFLVWVPERSAKVPPPYLEAAGLRPVAARWQSGRLGGQLVAQQVSRYADVEEPAATFSVRLVRLTSELFGPAIQRAAIIEPSSFRWAVLRSTTARGDAHTVEALIELLANAGEDHEFVVEALGRSGDARAVPALLDLLGRDHSGKVVQALGRLRDRRAVMPLIELLERRAGERPAGTKQVEPAPDDPGFDPEAEEIMNALESISGRDFPDARAWRKWAEQAASGHAKSPGSTPTTSPR